MTGRSRLVEKLILAAGGETASICEDWSIGWAARALVERSARTCDAVRVTGEADTGGTEGVGGTACDTRTRGRKLVIRTSQAEFCGSRTSRAGRIAILASIVGSIDERSRRARTNAFPPAEDQTWEATRALKLTYNRSNVEAWNFTSRAFRGAT